MSDANGFGFDFDEPAIDDLDDVFTNLDPTTRAEGENATPRAVDIGSHVSGDPVDDLPDDATAKALMLAPVAQALPEANLPSIDIQALLTFLPDIALKRAIDAAATAALAIAVTGDAGLAAADAARADLQEKIAHTVRCFADACSLANTLHKRLTGLRADFVANGEAAVEVLGKGILAEKRRLDAVAEAQRKADQVEADRLARETMAAAAKKAEQAQAPAPVVEQLKKQAQTAVAPPVAARAAAPLKASTVAEKWNVRLRGFEGQPAMADLTEEQRRVAIDLVRAVADGKAPLAALEINWSYLRKRAGSDRQTFAIAGIEAYDEGSVRSKGRR